jgi:hypothetical protein
MLDFFGCILGYAAINQFSLGLNLHPTFWKSLTEGELSGEADLRLVDQYSW